MAPLKSFLFYVEVVPLLCSGRKSFSSTSKYVVVWLEELRNHYIEEEIFAVVGKIFPLHPSSGVVLFFVVLVGRVFSSM